MKTPVMESLDGFSWRFYNGGLVEETDEPQNPLPSVIVK